jgi:poly-gamma-glutamate synthesis protein (capsule biosynthesis protein)
MMLDRSVRQKINQYGAEYPFALIKDFLIGNDIVVANAEGPFTQNPSKTLGVRNGPLTFTFDPAELPTLKNLGFTLLGQANNHTLNFGTAGLKESENNIEQAGLNWFGDPSNQDLHSFVTTIHGQKIAFIGYHQFAPSGLDNVTNEIKSAKAQGNFVIVYPHWGEEYLQNKNNFQTKIAHSFIDAGADAVIGSHPHVVEPIEVYKNKIIFYSLGNFIFDQAQSGPTSQGMSLGISLTSTSVSYLLYPINIQQEQASLMTGDARTEALNNLAKKSLVEIQVKEGIKDCVINLSRL